MKIRVPVSREVSSLMNSAKRPISALLCSSLMFFSASLSCYQAVAGVVDIQSGGGDAPIGVSIGNAGITAGEDFGAAALDAASAADSTRITASGVDAPLDTYSPKELLDIYRMLNTASISPAKLPKAARAFYRLQRRKAGRNQDATVSALAINWANASYIVETYGRGRKESAVLFDASGKPLAAIGRDEKGSYQARIFKAGSSPDLDAVRAAAALPDKSENAMAQYDAGKRLFDRAVFLGTPVLAGLPLLHAAGPEAAPTLLGAKNPPAQSAAAAGQNIPVPADAPRVYPALSWWKASAQSLARHIVKLLNLPSKNRDGKIWSFSLYQDNIYHPIPETSVLFNPFSRNGDPYYYDKEIAARMGMDFYSYLTLGGANYIEIRTKNVLEAAKIAKTLAAIPQVSGVFVNPVVLNGIKKESSSVKN
ncbi:MAG TPA: hypothetical protein VNH15_05930 [Elusimicrobiota bacterium]|nr:hypothetical protein [Elusimicrobiota bacterium]